MQVAGPDPMGDVSVLSQKIGVMKEFLYNYATSIADTVDVLTSSNEVTSVCGHNHMGVYAEVVAGGEVATGDLMVLL